MSPSAFPRPRLALIGVTGYASIHLKLVREALAAGAIELTAVVIINSSAVPDIVAELRAVGATIYADCDTFFTRETGRVDLCLVPVGIQWHTRLTVAALRAGMHVLVEKPLAGSLADAEAIRRAEQATGRWVAVGFQDLYLDEAHALKRRLLAGEIGRVTDVRLLGLWPRPRAYFTRNHWAGRIRADGADVLDSPLNNAFAHFVNLALFFAGSAFDRSARARIDSAELHRAHEIEMFDSAVVRGLTDSDARLWLGVSHATLETREPEIIITGTRGRVEWHHEKTCVLVSDNRAPEIIPLPDATHARRRMFAAVMQKLRAPATFVCTTELAEQHTRLIEDVQAFAPALPFPPESVHWRPDAATGSELPGVAHLAEDLNHAFSHGSALATHSAAMV